MNKKRFILVATVILGVALAASPLASADRPIREELPAADATGQFCPDFAVLVHPTRNNEFITIFSSGAAVITGALRVEVTNLETGETIALNIPGPGHLNEDGSQLTGTGPWLLFDEEGGFGQGEPAQTLYTTGRFVLTFDDEGNIASFDRPNHVVDICAALAV